MATIYEEDIWNIEEAIKVLTERGATRLDLNLHDEGVEAIVYWAGTVLRIDIKGLRS